MDAAFCWASEAADCACCACCCACCHDCWFCCSCCVSCWICCCCAAIASLSDCTSAAVTAGSAGMAEEAVCFFLAAGLVAGWVCAQAPHISIDAARTVITNCWLNFIDVLSSPFELMYLLLSG